MSWINLNASLVNRVRELTSAVTSAAAADTVAASRSCIVWTLILNPMQPICCGKKNSRSHTVWMDLNPVIFSYQLNLNWMQLYFLLKLFKTPRWKVCTIMSVMSNLRYLRIHHSFYNFYSFSRIFEKIFLTHSPFRLALPNLLKSWI